MQEMWVWFLDREESFGGESHNPLQYSCLENPMDRGAWWATVHGVAGSDMAEHSGLCSQVVTFRPHLPHQPALAYSLASSPSAPDTVPAPPHQCPLQGGPSQQCRSGEGCLITLLSILIQPRGSGSLFFFFFSGVFIALLLLSPFLLFEYFVTTRLLCPWDLPGKNTAVGCHYLFQGVFLTQGSNPGLLRADSLPSEIQGKPFTSY